jgi:alpha-beta hydrolase superfamily lysophospholipase
MDDIPELEYLADNVQITIGRDRVDDGVLGIDHGQVVLMRAGDGPPVDRLIVSAPATEVEATRPRSGIGMGMVLILAFGDTTYTVAPNAVSNSAFVTPKKLKRARAAVEAFEAALAAARSTSASGAAT